MLTLGRCWFLFLALPLLAQGPSSDDAQNCKDLSGDQAIAACTRVIRSGQLSPIDLAIVYDKRGNEWHGKREYNKAIVDYDEALRINPSYARAFYNRGVTRDAKGERDKAIADYSAAIRLDPSYDDAYVNRGNALDDRGEHDKAIADYSEAIRINPTFAPAFYNRAVAWEHKGENEKAHR